MTRNRTIRHLGAGIASLVMVAAATGCGNDDESSAPDADKPAITVGIQDFGESQVVSQVYGQHLASVGYDVDYQELGGFRDLVLTAFESGDINFTPEYAASMLEFLNDNAGEATNDVGETVDALKPQLEKKDLVAFEPTEAVNTNTFVVTEETAKAENLTSIGDLGDDLKLGGPQDCPTNPGCLAGLKSIYGVDLSGNFTPLDGGGPNTKRALKNGDIDVAVLFSTDGAIAENNWVVLEDDKGLLKADNIIPVASKSLADDGGDDLASEVDKVSATLTTDKLIELNKRFDIDKEDAKDIAEEFLADEGLN